MITLSLGMQALAWEAMREEMKATRRGRFAPGCVYCGPGSPLCSLPSPAIPHPETVRPTQSSGSTVDQQVQQALGTFQKCIFSGSTTPLESAICFTRPLGDWRWEGLEPLPSRRMGGFEVSLDLAFGHIHLPRGKIMPFQFIPVMREPHWRPVYLYISVFSSQGREITLQAQSPWQTNIST